ncbi:siderophore-interacting protein [Thalassobius sp. MITS945101]|uniref:siderophore-interacting protein n=1 Tax=Thalassobius sp. MITS945101 TaxID=3096994 RepID=UPI003999AAB8
MLVDVYRHGGGRMTERVKQVCEGADLALIGPWGTGVLDRAEVTLCGDETAYPALARIVESLPEGAKANVLLSNLSGAQDYPFPERDGVQLTWMTAPEPSAFAFAAAALHREQPMGFLWFASEAAEVAEMRTHIKAEGWPKADVYAATYWTRPR